MPREFSRLLLFCLSSCSWHSYAGSFAVPRWQISRLGSPAASYRLLPRAGAGAGSGGGGSLSLSLSAASCRGRRTAGEATPASTSSPHTVGIYASHTHFSASTSRICTRMAGREAGGASQGVSPERQEEEEEGSRGPVPRGPWPQYLAAMALSGAALGPFLDGYHSAFGVLAYTNPIPIMLGGVQIVVSDWWVPEMFALAAIILGVSYPVLDNIFKVETGARRPSGPAILTCVGCFCLQYWSSGLLFSSGASLASLNIFLAVTAALCVAIFDRTPTGLIMAAVTGIAGPMVELGLLIAWPKLTGYELYHYAQPDFAGAIPLWICWVYACGAPAVGNLGRGLFSALDSRKEQE